MRKSEQIEVSADVYALLQDESPAGGARFEANGESGPPPPRGPEDYGLPGQDPARPQLEPREGLKLEFLDPTTWEGQPVPPRRWLVPHRIPLGNVTMLNGDGAAGKTTIALQLLAATVRGTDWLGATVDEPGNAIFLTAEEDRDEIHRRIEAIVAHHGIQFGALAGMHLLCMPGADPVLGTADKTGVIRPTPLFESLLKAASEIRPTLIAIEAAADVFAGNENDRSQVRQFLGLLRRLAVTTGAAVLLIAHPSLSGLASGSGTSGSTAWNNSVRSRLYFTSAKARDGDEPDGDVRELKIMKSNYGPAGEVVRLRWQRGVFVPEGGPGTLQRVAAEAQIDEAYLDCLDAVHGRGLHVGPYTGRAYVSRLLGPNAPRRLGMKTLAPLLGALGVKLILAEDPIAMERYCKAARGYGKRNESVVRFRRREGAK